MNVEPIKDFDLLGHQVYGSVQNPLFLAKDIAQWIDFTKDYKGEPNVSIMLSTVDDNEKLKSNIQINGVWKEVWLLTEFGLYEVLFQSCHPNANLFKTNVKNIIKKISMQKI